MAGGKGNHGSSDDLDDSVLVEMARHLKAEPGAAWQEMVAPNRRYEIGALLGAGGMGTVHRAVDRVLGREVALKFLRSDDPQTLERFQREARAQARIEHPNICRVYEVGDLAGRPFIAMQLVGGKTLAALLGELARDDKIRVVREVALAVQAAHDVGLIHRDLKPGNILVERDERGGCKPYVMDFGIAREVSEPGLTVTGQLLGTPQYMAPEQVLGRKKSVSARSDVYALGATLYHALAGAPPFVGESASDVLFKVVEEDAVPLRRHDATIPVALETIVLRCLSKSPAARYASARALAEDLGRYLTDEPIEARRPGVLERLGKTARKHAVVATALAVAPVALTAGLLLAHRAGGPTTAGARAPSSVPSSLFALSIGDAAPRPLAAGLDGVVNLDVAPDGRELALQLRQGGRDQVILLSLEDGRQRILGEGGAPTYAVDGKEVFWAEPSPDRLVAAPRAGGEKRVVIDLPGRVLFMGPGIQDVHLLVRNDLEGVVEQWDVPGNGDPPRRVAPADAYEFSMPITATGWRLAWPRGSRERILLPPGADVGEVVDGRATGVDGSGRFIYLRRNEIRWRDLASGEESVLNVFPVEHLGRVRSARPSPDGRTLYYWVASGA